MSHKVIGVQINYRPGPSWSLLNIVVLTEDSSPDDEIPPSSLSDKEILINLGLMKLIVLVSFGLPFISYFLLAFLYLKYAIPKRTDITIAKPTSTIGITIAATGVSSEAFNSRFSE